MKGLIYQNKVVVKPGPIPEFYRRCCFDLRPPRFREYHTDNGDAYTYNYVPGHTARPTDIPIILSTVEKRIWLPTDRDLKKESIRCYLGYVWDLTHKYAFRHVSLVHEAFNVLLQKQLPEVVLVHGDLTFENIIITKDGSPVFIDPGRSNQMSTPALDRGKLLQSYVMRWEDRAWDDPMPWPDWADIIDWAFLVTHWVRLVRYWPDLYTDTGFKTLERIRPT